LMGFLVGRVLHVAVVHHPLLRQAEDRVATRLTTRHVEEPVWMSSRLRRGRVWPERVARCVTEKLNPRCSRMVGSRVVAGVWWLVGLVCRCFPVFLRVWSWRCRAW
jgi:vacuolar-type H+-ATPase catalytic subunit A/Vma1